MSACVRCGAEIKIIDDPAVIRLILKHVGLWRERMCSESGTAPIEESELDADVVYESVDDGWPGYKEPTVTCH